jgi:hypothetical protein
MSFFLYTSSEMTRKITTSPQNSRIRPEISFETEEFVNLHFIIEVGIGWHISQPAPDLFGILKNVETEYSDTARHSGKHRLCPGNGHNTSKDG